MFSPARICARVASATLNDQPLERLHQEPDVRVRHRDPHRRRLIHPRSHDPKRRLLTLEQLRRQNRRRPHYLIRHSSPTELGRHLHRPSSRRPRHRRQQTHKRVRTHRRVSLSVQRLQHIIRVPHQSRRERRVTRRIRLHRTQRHKIVNRQCSRARMRRVIPFDRRRSISPKPAVTHTVNATRSSRTRRRDVSVPRRHRDTQRRLQRRSRHILVSYGCSPSFCTLRRRLTLSTQTTQLRVYGGHISVDAFPLMQQRDDQCCSSFVCEVFSQNGVLSLEGPPRRTAPLSIVGLAPGRRSQTRP